MLLIILKGDLNSKWDDVCIQPFFETYRIKSPIKEPTCYKNPDNSSCVDLTITKILCFKTHVTNILRFQNSCVIETELSDFLKMYVTGMKTTIEKLQVQLIQFRNYKSSFAMID